MIREKNTGKETEKRWKNTGTKNRKIIERRNKKRKASYYNRDKIMQKSELIQKAKKDTKKDFKTKFALFFLLLYRTNKKQKIKYRKPHFQ